MLKLLRRLFGCYEFEPVILKENELSDKTLVLSELENEALNENIVVDLNKLNPNFNDALYEYYNSKNKK